MARFYYAGDRIVQERNGADAKMAEYTYGNYVDEALTMDRKVGGTGPFKRFYFHTNRMFSTYALTDSTGTVAERYSYTAYGLVTTFDGGYNAPMSSSRVGNPFTFTGRELDPETGLMHYRARTYDPAEGRFKQRDAAEQGLNRYEAVGGQPTARADPAGLYVVAIHREMTVNGVFANMNLFAGFRLRMGAQPSECAAVVAQRIADGNEGVDLKRGFLPSGTFFQLHKHFNRTWWPFGLSEGRQEALQAYQEHLRRTERYFDAALEKKTEKGCGEALTHLGVLSHSWQDFFAHAIHTERGWAVFSAGIIRTPSVPQDVWPSSFNPRAWAAGLIPRAAPTFVIGKSIEGVAGLFGAKIDVDRIPILTDAGFGLLEGEHPTFYEPVPLGSPEGQARRGAAQGYTIHRYGDSLVRWLSVCSCWCPGSF